MDMPTQTASASFRNSLYHHGSFATSSPSWRLSTPSNGAHVLSGMDWLDCVVALHEQVRAELLGQQKHFLLKKNADYFRDLLNGSKGLLLGAFADDQLVGSTALVWADSLQEAFDAGRLTAPDPSGKLKKKFGKGRVGIIQSMGVHNAYMGRSFSKGLLQAAVSQASKHGCEHVFAQIAEQNTLSWLRFLDQGFAIIHLWDNGHRRFLLRWLPPQEKTALMKRAKPKNRQIYGKSYTLLPSMLTQLTAKLEQGHTAFLDNDANEPGALNVVFSPTRRRIVQALSALRKVRQASI